QVEGVDGELYMIQTTSDAQMLSLAALRHMQQSDIALVDEDIDGQIIELIRRDANISKLNQSDRLIQIERLLKDNQRVCILTNKPLAQWQGVYQQFSTNFTVRQFNSALSIGE
ncbi:MAG: hypothetical protein ACPGSN_05930, partial [Psychrobium sp.]